MEEENKEQKPEAGAAATASAEPEKKAPNKFVRGVRDYFGAVGEQVTSRFNKSCIDWETGHKVRAIFNAVVTVPVMAQVAPVLGMFDIDTYATGRNVVDSLPDGKLRDDTKSTMVVTEVLGGVLVLGLVAGTIKSLSKLK